MLKITTSNKCYICNLILPQGPGHKCNYKVLRMEVIGMLVLIFNFQCGYLLYDLFFLYLVVQVLINFHTDSEEFFVIL